MLMAEIERIEHGDSGKARAWTLRAVRARHDPVWTADGYVSDRWRPVSPVTGRLDAFQWQTPVASLPSDKGRTIESSPFEEAMLAAPSPNQVPAPTEGLAEPPREVPAAPAPQETIQDNSPVAPKVEADAEPKVEAKSEAKPEAKSEVKTEAKIEHDTAEVAPTLSPANPPNPATPSPAESPAAANTAQPLFRTRADLTRPPVASVPAVIPIIRPPDDPGVDEEAPIDEFSEQIGAPKGQAGGWRGFWARLGG